MKKGFIFLVLAAAAAVLTAADSTEIAIFNQGKNATLKALGGTVTPQTAVNKDPKTRAQRYRCLYFSITEKNNNPKTFDLLFEASKGVVSIYIGHKKADLFTWTSFSIDGKEQITDKNGETFRMRKFTVSNFDKPQTVKLTATYRVPTKKELNASKKALKENKKRPKKSSK